MVAQEGWRGDIGSGGAGDVRGRACTSGVDRRHAVVARVAIAQPRVRVLGVGQPGVGHPVAPGRAPIGRHLDPVAGDRGASGVRRRGPCQIDIRFGIRHRHQPGRRPGDGGFLRLSRDGHQNGKHQQHPRRRATNDRSYGACEISGGPIVCVVGAFLRVGSVAGRPPGGRGRKGLRVRPGGGTPANARRAHGRTVAPGSWLLAPGSWLLAPGS